jgi:hypothetical protein
MFSDSKDSKSVSADRPVVTDIAVGGEPKTKPLCVWHRNVFYNVFGTQNEAKKVSEAIKVVKLIFMLIQI